MKFVFPKVYPILDSSVIPSERRAEFLHELGCSLADAGVTLLEYRNKNGTEEAIVADARILCQAMQSEKVKLILDDRADLVDVAGFDGVHIDAGDIVPAAARQLLGRDRIIGTFAGSDALLPGILAEPADYFAIGPVFTTRTKQTDKPPIGVEGVRRLREQAGPDVVLSAAAGITLETAMAVLNAGANMVAVSEAIFRAPRPSSRVPPMDGSARLNGNGPNALAEPVKKIRETIALNSDKTSPVATPKLTSTEDSAAATHEAPKMVQTLGLFSSTALVAGSMIGSGIFLVNADIARTTNSPALVVGAWVVTAVLTMIGALSYGELAAMMPKAGGQYVYLRESLGPLWGFLYGWTLFLVIQTGTIAAVCVAFGKFLGVFFPTISTTHWLWHIAHVPSITIGPMVLGNMEIGVNTANLTGIIIVFFLAIVNMFGLKLGALIQNVFTSAKALSLAALVLITLTVGRNATAMAANFGQGLSEFWKNAGWKCAASGAGGRRRTHRPGEPGGDSGRGAGGVAVFIRCVEQHHFHRRRSEESAPQYSAVAGSGHGLRAHGLHSGDHRLHDGAADAWRSAWRRCHGARHPVRVGRSRCDGGAG